LKPPGIFVVILWGKIICIKRLHLLAFFDAGNIMEMYRKGKPTARWGRKVMDLPSDAQRLEDRQTAEILFGGFFINSRSINGC
jgi:hypothetical protein